ncbi:hypothetical protein [Rufibacter psychrotolerans]|uniref:hypothetical protein n=1 Tax=Rufibacter psychrotolerans TaxID=2812556 RepID=UPI001968453A|nr:hypothetical protein [Rufibacter sp. SYSU D00308]
MKLACQTLPYINVYLETNLRVVHVECQGFVPSSIYRQTILRVLDVIKAHHLVGWVYDIRKLKSLHPHDQDWFIDDVLPLLTQTLVRKLAVLESTSELGQLNLSHLVYSTHTPFSFELQYFADVASSLEWIAQTSATDHRKVPALGLQAMPLA